jgi:PadR family transcriptional regulator PadR
MAPNGKSAIPQKTDVPQGTLALMVLTTLEALGSLHGFGIARRIEQTSGQRFSVNPGTLYPTLLKLEQEGAIASSWGVSENGRRARFYELTKSGRALLARETAEWRATNDIIGRFLTAARVK